MRIGSINNDNTDERRVFFKWPLQSHFTACNNRTQLWKRPFHRGLSLSQSKLSAIKKTNVVPQIVTRSLSPVLKWLRVVACAFQQAFITWRPIARSTSCKYGYCASDMSTAHRAALVPGLRITQQRIINMFFDCKCTADSNTESYIVMSATGPDILTISFPSQSIPCATSRHVALDFAPTHNTTTKELMKFGMWAILFNHNPAAEFSSISIASSTIKSER